MSNKTFVLYFGLSLFSSTMALQLFGDEFSFQIIALYALCSIPTFLLFNSSRVGTRGAIVFDIFAKCIFISVIDLLALEWHQNRPYWFPDTNGFWSVAMSFVKGWEQGKIPTSWTFHANNGLITNFVWAIFISIFGENPWIIPLCNVFFVGMSLGILLRSMRLTNLPPLWGKHLIGIFATSPLTYYWILWGQKDIIVAFFIACISYFFIRMALSTKNWSALIAVSGLAGLLWLERPYLSIFAFIAVSFFFLMPPRIHQRRSLGITILPLCAVLVAFFSLSFFDREIKYLFGHLLYFDTAETESWGYNASYPINFLRLLFTPLPSKVALDSSVNILEIAGFLPNMFLQVMCLKHILVVAKHRPRLLFLISPYVTFLVLWATFLPGYNRVRDTFVPMIICFIGMSIYISMEKALKCQSEHVSMLP